MVRSTSLIVSEIIAGLLAGMVALVGLVAWRLHAGPVPLDFLTPHLEEALKTEGRGYTVEIDETVAVWAGWRNAVDIIATDVVVTAPDDSTLARVPKLSLGLSLRALVRGNVAPTSLDAIGPNVRVIRQEDGEFALGFIEAIDESQPADVDGPPRAKLAAGRDVIDFLVDELLGDPDPSRSFGYLRRISIQGGQVVFEDRVAGSYFRSPDAEIVLLKGESGVTGDAKLKLHYGDRQADFTIRTGIEKKDLGYFASLDFNDVEPAAFATSLPPQLSAITALSMPLNGSVNLRGKVRGELESFDFDLLGAAGKLELIDLFREPLNVGSLRVQGSATADFSTVRIDQAIVDLGDVTAFAEAAMEPAGDGDGMRLTFSAYTEKFEIRELHRFWPVSAQPGARKWVTENIYEGIADKGTIDLALTIEDGGITLEKLEGTLAYTDLGISYFKEMTPVVGIAGAGTFDRHGFYLGVGDARLAENIRVTGGQVHVVDMDQKGKARLVIDVKTEGPIVTALKVLDEDPLHYGDKLGFDPADLGGVSSADLRFELPLIKGLTGDMLDVTATGKLTGVSAPNGPFDLAVSEGALDMEVTRAGMLLAGDVRLNGVPAEIIWNENFDAGAKFKRRFEVKASPDEAQRLALDLPDLSYWIEGAAPTSLTYTVVAERDPQLVVRSDLTPALVRIPEAAWQKDPGEPGRLEIDARVLKAGNLIFDRLNVKTGDAEGTVKIEFLPDMSDLDKVTLQDLRYRGNDVRGEITLMDSGGYRVDIEGDRVDVRHFLTDEYERIITEAGGGADGGVNEKGKPLTIKANFKEAVTGEGRRMHRGTFNGAYNGRDWEAVVLYATLGEGAELKVNYGKGEKGYELLVESNDAGQALRSLGWWDEIRGGSMVIEGRRKAIDAPMTGNVWVKDFRMKEAPAGIKLLQIITLVGLPAAAAAGEGVSFAGFEGAYTYDDGLLTFGEMEAWGPVGVYVYNGGWMNFNENSIAMTGHVVPANTLQKVLGFIPFLGLFLGDGLVAADFKVSGTLDEPDVVGSGASLFKVGFLRKLFRLEGDPEGDEPEDKPGAEPPGFRD